MHGDSRSTRREFLQGKSAADVLQQAGLSALGPEELAEPLAPPYLVKLSRRAMACEFEVFLNAGQYPQGTEVALAALDLIDQLEDQLSVFRSHSEVSRLNQSAAHQPVVIEGRLFQVLATAVQIHQQTGGTYDITAGRLSDVWGFKRRAGSIPDQESLAAALESVGSQYLELDNSASTVRYLRSGLEINLGSIGKGYALDRCAEMLALAGVHDFLLHGGNSSVLGRGTSGQQAGWIVGVRNPLHPRRRLGELLLRDSALATSGSGTQYFVHDGRRYGHILDPRTGWPSEGVLSVSVLAPTAAEADALSTAFYVMGPTAARQYCEAHARVAGVMLCPGVRAGSIETHLFAIDEHHWREVEENASDNSDTS